MGQKKASLTTSRRVLPPRCSSLSCGLNCASRTRVALSWPLPPPLFWLFILSLQGTWQELCGSPWIRWTSEMNSASLFSTYGRASPGDSFSPCSPCLPTPAPFIKEEQCLAGPSPSGLVSGWGRWQRRGAILSLPCFIHPKIQQEERCWLKR